MGGRGKIVMNMDSSRGLLADWSGLQLSHNELQTGGVVRRVRQVGGNRCLKKIAR